METNLLTMPKLNPPEQTFTNKVILTSPRGNNNCRKEVSCMGNVEAPKDQLPRLSDIHNLKPKQNKPIGINDAACTIPIKVQGKTKVAKLADYPKHPDRSIDPKKFKTQPKFDDIRAELPSQGSNETLAMKANCPLQQQLNLTAYKELQTYLQFDKAGDKRSNYNLIVANVQFFKEQDGQKVSLGTFPLQLSSDYAKKVYAPGNVDNFLATYAKSDLELVTDNMYNLYFAKLQNLSKSVIERINHALASQPLTEDTIMTMLEQITNIFNNSKTELSGLNLYNLFCLPPLQIGFSNGSFYNLGKKEIIKTLLSETEVISSPTEAGAAKEISKLEVICRAIINNCNKLSLITPIFLKELFEEKRGHSETYVAAAISHGMLDFSFITHNPHLAQATSFNLALLSTKSMCDTCSYLMPNIQKMLITEFSNRLKRVLIATTQYDYIDASGQTSQPLYTDSDHHFLQQQVSNPHASYQSKYLMNLAQLASPFVNKGVSEKIKIQLAKHYLDYEESNKQHQQDTAQLNNFVKRLSAPLLHYAFRRMAKPEISQVNNVPELTNQPASKQTNSNNPQQEKINVQPVVV
jgi:hypothetical protein